MNDFKRIIATILIVSLIFNVNGILTLAQNLNNETSNTLETTETKIIEQLKNDLGETKASQILLNSENENLNNSENVIVDSEVEPGEDLDEINNENENIDEPEEDEEYNNNFSEEELEEDEEPKNNLIEEEPEENEDSNNSFNEDESKEDESNENLNIENNDDDLITENESSIDSSIVIEISSSDDSLIDSYTQIEENETSTTILNENQNLENNNIIASESGIEYELNINDLIFEEEIISSISELEFMDDDYLFGSATPWMYWYLTDGGHTIRYSNIQPPSTITYHEISNQNGFIEYNDLDKSDITFAIFENTINAKSCNKFFYNFNNLTYIENLTYLNTNQVRDMERMFFGCSNLSSIDLSSFNTQNVTDFSGMFYGCSSLENIDLTNFNKSSAKSLNSMFYNCSELTQITFGNSFNTQDVTNMSSMFYNCKKIPSIDVSNFNTSNVTSMKSMFSGCSALTTLDVSNFDTLNVTSMSSMFSGCGAITTLDVSNFNTSNVTNMDAMFSGCGALTTLDVSNFYTSNVTNMGSMFSKCSALTTLDVSNFNTSNVTNMDAMFSGCGALTTLDVSNFNTSNVTNMDYMFDSLMCETINIDNFITNNVTSMRYMFSNCRNLQNLDLYNFNTENVTDMAYMFCECNKLESITLSGNFKTENVIDMDSMFYNCSKLDSLDLSSFDVKNVVNMKEMFAYCSSITNLDLSGFITSSVENIISMFTDCINLQYLNVDNFNTRYVTNMRSMFYNCKSLQSIDLGSFDTSYVSNMSDMFYNCSSLTSLNLSNFNTSNVTNFINMFLGCTLLETLDIRNFDMSNSNNYNNMLYRLVSLNSIIISESISSIINELKLENDWKESTLGTIYYFDYTNNKTTIPYNSEGGYYTKVNAIGRATVIFDTDDGSYINSITVDINTVIDEPEEPTKSNYTFLGWYDQSLENPYEFPLNITGDMVICAKWEEISNVTIYWYIENANELHLSSIEPINPNYNSDQHFTYFTETSAPWNEYLENITNVIIDNVIEPTTMYAWFSNLVNLTEITNIDNIHTNNVKSMQYLFYNCKHLETINLDSFETNSLVSMGQMFSGCYALTSIDISNFNTNNVTNMANLFMNCKNAHTINITNIDTSNVKNMALMFSKCSNLSSLDLSNFNTDNVTNMISMFSNCSSLASLNLENFNTSNVTNMSGMFSGCNNLNNLNILNLDTRKVTSMHMLFYNCKNLSSIEFGDYFKTEHVTDFGSMFEGCSKLQNIDVSEFDTSMATDMSRMFSCSERNINGNNPFYVSELTEIIGLENFDTSHVSNMYRMFGGLSSITSLNISNFITSNVSDMGQMFQGLNNITNLNLSSFDTSHVNNMDEMFWGCDQLSELNLSNFNTSRVTNMYGMFSGLSNASEINISHFDTINVKNMAAMFFGCKSLTNIDVSSFDTRNVINMSQMFEGCDNLTSINVDNFDTSKVNYIFNMFSSCNNLTVLDLSSFNTSKVTDISQMFFDCQRLEKIYVSENFVTTLVTTETNYNCMFGNCFNLVGGNGTPYNPDNNDKDYARIDTETTPGYFTASTNANQQFTANDYILNRVWYPQEKINNVSRGEITKIKFIKNNISQHGTRFIIGKNGNESQNLYAYLNGTEVTIQIPSNGTLYAPENSSNLFYMYTGEANLDSIENINLLNTSNVKNMAHMFDSNSNLKNLNLSTFNTSNVVNMESMFENCINLESINISFNTEKVTNMKNMFKICKKITSLDLSTFNTRKVTDMNGMFGGCEELITLNISSFKTENVIHFENMFNACKRIESLDLSHFDTSNAINMESMFRLCNRLSTLNLSSFNTSKVARMTFMFEECSELTELNLSNFSTVNCRYMDYMFYNCTDLESLNISNFDTRNVISINGMFQNCQSLTELDISSFDTRNIGTHLTWGMDALFSNCSSLTKIYASELFTIPLDSNGNEFKIKVMFSGCINLVGGNGFEYNGTIYINDEYIYDGSHYDNMYARINTASTNGYFTKKDNTLSYNFDVLKNAWNFGNFSVDISKEKYLKVLGKTLTYELIGNADSKTAVGVCYGLAGLIKDFYSNENNFNSTYPDYENIYLVNRDTEVKNIYNSHNNESYISDDIIQMAYLYQKTLKSQIQIKEQMKLNTDLKINNKLNIESILDSINNGQVCVVLIANISSEDNDKSWGHALVAYDATDTVIKVYDCNFPNDSRCEITYSLNNNNSTWSYNKMNDVGYSSNESQTTLKDMILYGNQMSYEDLVDYARQDINENIENSNIIINTTNTTLNVKLNSGDTSVLDSNSPYYYYDFGVNYDNGNIVTSDDYLYIIPTNNSNSNSINIEKTDVDEHLDIRITSNNDLVEIKSENIDNAKIIINSDNENEIKLEGTQGDQYTILYLYDNDDITFEQIEITGLLTSNSGTSKFTNDNGIHLNNLKPTSINSILSGSGEISNIENIQDSNDTEFNIKLENINDNSVLTIRNSENQLLGQSDTVYVSFDTDGGTNIPDIPVTIDNLICRPSNDPTKRGYSFDDWYEDSDKTVIFDFDTKRINENTTIYAKWDPKIYRMRYIPNGGVITGSANFSKTYGSPLSSLKTPTRTNYIFDGWYNNTNFEIKYDGSDDNLYVEGQEGTNINLYAKWTYKLKLNLNGVVAVASDSIIKTVGINLDDTDLKDPIPEDNRYEFVQWNNNNGDRYNLNEDLNPNPNNEADLWAKWKVQLLLNNKGLGTFVEAGLKATNSCPMNDNVTLPTLTAEGYTFNGWYEDPECTNESHYNGGFSYLVNEPKTLYAKWTPNQYTIVYTNGGVSSAELPSSISKTYGIACSLSSPSEPNGYIFDGWYKNEDLEDVNRYDGTTDLTYGNGNTVSIYPRWKVKVSFDANGHGKNPEPIFVVKTTGKYRVPILENVVGYSFGGWYTNSECTAGYHNPNSDQYESTPKTLYAKWTPNQYTINYNANGGSVSPTSFDKTYGTEYAGTLATPTKDGYTFDGWYTTSGLTTVYDMTTDNIYVEGQTSAYYIYAKWTAKTYTINYNANGGTVTGNTSFTKTYGTAYSGTLTTPTKIGYTFGGWFTDDGTFNCSYDKSNDNIYEEGTTEYNIYAKWIPKTYTINYNANGGLVNPTSFTKTYGTAFANDLATPTKNGYTFGGWYTDNTTFNNPYNKNNDDIYVEGTNVYNIFVKWIENNYTVTLNLNGGAFAAGYTDFTYNTTGNYERSRLYTAGTTLPTNQNITKTGYTFDGWYEDAGFNGSKVTSVAANTATHKEYWLKWNENSYSIIYNENGGTYVNGYTKPTSRLYTESVTLPNDTQISKVGYDFGGWYEDSSFIGSQVNTIDANVIVPKVLYAKWNEKTYSVTYKDYNGTDLTTANWQVGYTAPISRRYTESLALPGDGNVIKTNSFFLGWFKEGDANESIITSIEANVAEDIILRAKWDTAYEVTFNYSGYGTNTTDLVRNGHQVGRPNYPTYANKRFVNWYKTYVPTAPTLDEQYQDLYNFSAPVTELFTLYAKWEDATTYEVTFNLTSGVHPNLGDITGAPENQYIVSGDKVSDPLNPISNGYTFKGWFTDNTFTTSYEFSTPITEVKTIYGMWELITYTITYNKNNGEWVGAYTPNDSWTWTTADTIQLPNFSNLTRTHYTFDGWFTSSDFSGAQVTSLVGRTTNLILYAKWIFNPAFGTYHTINFLPGGGSGTMNTQYVFEGENTTLNANTFTNSGYTFNRWISSDGSTFTNRQQITTLSDNLVLTAEWRANSPYNPYGPIPYIPSGGGYSGGGGGGGGGGGRAASALTNNALNTFANQTNTNQITTLKLNMTKSIKNYLDSDKTNWVKDTKSGSWKLKISHGTYATGGFYLMNNMVKLDGDITKISTDTYYFNSQGNMVTGWVQTSDNKWFFFENAKNGNEGKMALGWKKVDDKYYFFTKDGSMLVNDLTPDGFIVGADGAYIN